MGLLSRAAHKIKLGLDIFSNDIVLPCSCHEVKNPADLDKCYEYCAEMRDAAGELNAEIKSRQEEAATKALARLTKSCETCHAAFHKGE